MKLLSDKELKKALLGKIIIGGDDSCLRPNSYILRLGAKGEFKNTGKEFEIGKAQKGIRVDPGHSVGVVSFETLDFRRETVDEVFPGCALHAFLSPTTDLSREGVVAAATQVDAGYHGTLNWTLNNTSSECRKFIFKEKVYRLSVLKLDDGEEISENLYAGDYQGEMGYVRSQRAGAPVGMKESEWVDAHTKDGPEDLLKHLMKSGYPWNVLGTEFKTLGDRFETVTNEYADIYDSMKRIEGDVQKMKEADIHGVVKQTLQEEVAALQNRWIIGSTIAIGAIGAFFLNIISNVTVMNFIKSPAGNILIFCLFIAIVVSGVLFFRKK